uniref:U-box domain-containing protein n=1 Tax=Oryza meridionalis TaxID=40149 RepID=A0A0E0FD81_9ORYZ
MPPVRLTSASAALVDGVVGVVADRPSAKAVKVGLHVLCRLCPWSRNRVKAVDAGAVSALVLLLLDEGCGGDRHACELAIVAIDHIGGCTEGHLALMAHPTGLAAVACAATRLSAAGTESAVRALHAVATGRGRGRGGARAGPGAAVAGRTRRRGRPSAGIPMPCECVSRERGRKEGEKQRKGKEIR